MIFREEIHLIDLHEYLYEQFHYYYLLLKYSISLCAHQIVFDSLMIFASSIYSYFYNNI